MSINSGGVYPLPFFIWPLTLQKSRMPQVRGVKGEAVVIYCEPLTTKEVGYYRLSRRVNNTVKKLLFIEITNLGLCLDRSLCIASKPLFKLFYKNHTVLFMQL